ncbi:glutamate carboxypeptidase II [Macrophomina phaseolina]|uniref:Glutamate carboxypeptidase II n=1 Tax=Macrophomina phaseolina TaxID=35725 RepID=A0ABQ8G201_9PEZI|nr:glutamate carboxypeptidase II [Macrophomina phaseolina]
MLVVFSLLIADAAACQKDLLRPRGTGRPRLITRQETAFPPVLSDIESILVNSFDNTTIDEWSYYYTHGLHIAGTNESQAQWTADKWSSFGVPSSLAEYWAFLNYPVSQSVSVVHPNGSSYAATLIEEVLAEDETTSYPNSVPAFHGLSWSGNASAEYVYVGRGQQVDFDRLIALGVPLEGKIALAKYGGPFRGLKVKNAQENGMIGAVIFTDPGDDGNITEANGYAAYPDGPARNPTSIQRGSVQFLSQYPGDPTTPGYPSKQDSPRADTISVTPRIPSVPISWKDAVPFLAALDGYGTPGEEVNRTNWVGALNVTYSTGPAPGTTIALSNLMEEKITPIWNAIGIINGTNADETVIIGNHRDAWIVGGAADPNSGSAVVVELSKALGKLLATGWKPKRNIVLASWDAEEYGLYGSTEWVEEYIPWLADTSVAYLNIDVGASGPRPDFSATPELHTIVTELMKKVLWPYAGTGELNQTLYDTWYEETEGEFGVLGSGSDYTSFLHNGIGSIDMGAGGGANDPIYHYHSNYDTYHWMATYGDPGFLVHKAIGQFLSLLAYHLADDPIIPFDIPNYTTQLRLYFDDLNATVVEAGATLDLGPLSAAIDTFEEAANAIASVAAEAALTGDEVLISRVNAKYRDFQRGFTSQGGLPDRQFFRHVVFAPGIDTGYAPVTYPGVTEAVDAGNLTLAASEVLRAAAGIERAAAILVP